MIIAFTTSSKIFQAVPTNVGVAISAFHVLAPVIFLDPCPAFRTLLDAQRFQRLIVELELPVFACEAFVRLLAFHAEPLSAQLALESVAVLFGFACQEDLLAVGAEATMVGWVLGNEPGDLQIAQSVEVLLAENPSDILNVHFLAVLCKRTNELLLVWLVDHLLDVRREAAPAKAMFAVEKSIRFLK